MEYDLDRRVSVACDTHGEVFQEIHRGIWNLIEEIKAKCDAGERAAQDKVGFINVSVGDYIADLWKMSANNPWPDDSTEERTILWLWSKMWLLYNDRPLGVTEAVVNYGPYSGRVFFAVDGPVWE